MPEENVLLSALLMLISSVFMITLATCVKLARDEVTFMQAVLYRSLFSLIPLVLVMWRRRISPFSARWPLLATRGLVGSLALSCYFFAVTHIELVNTLALQQLSPIFVAFLSVWMLKEHPRASHFLLAGFCLSGALLVIQPTRGMVSLLSVSALCSALFSSLAYVIVRSLTRTESTTRIVFWFACVGTLFASPFVLFSWSWPSLRGNLLLITAGLLAAPAQWFLTAAYRQAPAHIAAAFSYAMVPLAYLSGILIWGEQPDPLSLVGIAIIVAGGVAIVLRVRANSRRSGIPGRR